MAKKTTKRKSGGGKKKVAQPMTTAQQLGSLIKSARDIMRKDKGLNGDLDRLPMLTWIMFLKFLDDMEQVDEEAAKLEGKRYRPVLETPYRWRDWAAKADGITGDELIAFVNQEEAVRPNGTKGPGLLAHLRELQSSEGKNRRDVVAQVFSGVVNRMISGYLLRDVINKVDGIHFSSSEELHTLGRLYESMLREMRDAAGDSGEFYTPRPVVQLMVAVTNPKLGETVLDPACGTGGFLAEAFDHLAKQVQTTKDRRILQELCLRGQEAKPLPFMLAQMNLLLHGLEYPSIAYGNSLARKVTEIGDRDRVDVIVTNPPFGGEEEAGIRNNFPADRQASETALLFLQLIMRLLKRPEKNNGRSGRAALVVPNTTLFYHGVAARLRRDLVASHGLYAVVRLPKGVFEPYTDIETNLLFLDRSKADGRVLYYEHLPPDGRKQYSKTMPLARHELDECHQILARRTDSSPRAWFEDCDALLADEGVNLDRHNPKTERPHGEATSAVLTRLARATSDSSARIGVLSEASERIARLAANRQSWSALTLGSVLVRRKDVVQIDDSDTYKRITIRVKGRGVVLRDEVPGSEIGTKRQFVVESGQFVLSKIDARNGAFGVVPEECDEAIITGNFWAYEVDTTQLDIDLLHHFTQSGDFLEFCIRSSPGATNRRYLQEELFLKQAIRVPSSIAEQQSLASALAVIRAESALHARHLLEQKDDAVKVLESSLHEVFGTIQPSPDNRRLVQSAAE